MYLYFSLRSVHSVLHINFLLASQYISLKFWGPTTSSLFLFPLAHHSVDTRCGITHFMSQAVNTWNMHNFDLNTNT
jgi:hypothetical protein